MMRNLLTLLVVGSSLILFTTCRLEEKLEPTKADTYIKLIGDPEYPLTAVDARMTESGDYVLLANVEREGTDGAIFAPMVINMDNNGNIKGEKQSFNTEDLNFNFVSHSLTLKSENSYFIVGEIVQTNASIVGIITYNNNDGFAGPFKVLEESGSLGEVGIGKAIEKIPTTGDYYLISHNPSTKEGKGFIVPNTITSDINPLADPKTFSIDGGVSDDIMNRMSVNNSGEFTWANRSSSDVAALSRATVDQQIVSGNGGRNYPGDTPFTIQAFNTDIDEQGSYVLLAGTIPDADKTEIQFYQVIPPAAGAAGSINYEHTAVIPEGTESVAGVTDAGTGGFLILGTSDDTQNSNGEEDFVLIRTGSNDLGDQYSDFTKYFGGENADVAVCVLKDNTDNGIIMFGYTEFADVNTLLIIKCDKNGEL